MKKWREPLHSISSRRTHIWRMFKSEEGFRAVFGGGRGVESGYGIKGIILVRFYELSWWWECRYCSCVFIIFWLKNLFYVEISNIHKINKIVEYINFFSFIFFGVGNLWKEPVWIFFFCHRISASREALINFWASS